MTRSSSPPRYPTLDINDQLAVEKVSKWNRPPRRGEIVVFDPPDAFWRLSQRERDPRSSMQIFVFQPALERTRFQLLSAAFTAVFAVLVAACMHAVLRVRGTRPDSRPNVGVLTLVGG